MDYFDVWKKYAVFEGRASRREFWTFALVNFLIFIILWAIQFALISSSQSNVAFGIVWAIYCLFALAALLPSLGVTVRRLHDVGKSGWWIFISLIPFVGSIILLVFELTDSQPGDNAYGSNPKGVGAAQPAQVPPAPPIA